MSQENEMERNAVLAQASYTFNNNNGDITETEKEIQSYGLEGYHIDPDLSDKYSITLFNDQDNEITLSVRGTKPSDIEDLYADYQILMNEERGPRFTREIDKMRNIQTKYPDYKHIVTGHSLGGNISYMLGKEFDIESHNFNAGASVGDAEGIVNDMIFNRNKPGVKNSHWYTTGRDPISIGNLHRLQSVFGSSQVKFVSPKIYRPLSRRFGPVRGDADIIAHSIKHFLPTGFRPRATEERVDTGLLSDELVVVPLRKRERKVMAYRDNYNVSDFCAENLIDPRCRIEI